MPGAIDPRLTTLAFPSTFGATLGRPPADAATRSGLDLAAGANAAPSGGGARPGAPGSAGSARVGAGGAVELSFTSAVAGMSYFDLIGGRYPDAVGLPMVLKALAGSAGARGALSGVLQLFEQRTGIKLDPGLVDRALQDPGALAGAMTVTPAQLSQGFDALVAAYHAGAVRDAAPKARSLASGFVLADLGHAPLERPRPEPKKIAEGLWHGDLPSALPDERVKANLALAETFDRLAENEGKPAAERFSVRYGNGSYDNLPDLLRALSLAGHEVQVEFVHRAANFADLKTKGPDGRWLDVPAALLVRTGIEHAGEEAVVPAAHAEMVIHVRSSGRTKGERIDADVKFYQGMNATGFFACDVTQSPSWCGWNATDRLRGKKAMDLVRLAGRLSGIINRVAAEQNLPFGAYGITGVCMDSVQLLRHAATGKLGYWPLLMRDPVLYPTLLSHLRDPDRRDDQDFRRLIRSMEAAPNDAQGGAAPRARILGSNPWERGREPLAGVVRAVEIFDATRPR